MLQDLYFELFKGHFFVQQIGDAGRGVEGDVLRLYHLVVRHDDSQFYNGLQLTDVAREGIRQHLLLRLRRESPLVDAVFLTKAVDEMLGEDEDVIPALPQRRQGDG